MRTILVGLGSPPPAYKSAAEAIAAAMVSPRAKRSASDSPLVAGSSIEAYTLHDQQASLYLTNKLLLRVTALEGRVDWEISRLAANEERNVGNVPAPVSLVWPSGKTTVWNPGELLASRLRFPITKLFAGQIFLNIYFGGGGALMFLPSWDRSEQSPLLHYEELEPPPPSPTR